MLDNETDAFIKLCNGYIAISPPESNTADMIPCSGIIGKVGHVSIDVLENLVALGHVVKKPQINHGVHELTKWIKK